MLFTLCLFIFGPLQVQCWNPWGLSFVEESFSNLPVARNTPERKRSCVCVLFWHCEGDRYNDIVDIRVLRNIKKRDEATCPGEFDVCCKVQCGHRNYRRGGFDAGFRITGDYNEASFGEFPWMVGIIKDSKYRCGGSLIHPQVAVTAAHCVDAEGNYVARVGEHNWEIRDEPLAHQDVQIRDIIPHPKYHPGSLSNDVALVVFHLAVELAENVGIVCLPPPGARLDYTRCVASGWGKNAYQDNDYQAILKKTDLPIVPRLRCVKALRRARLGAHFNLHESFICAGGEDRKDTCKGDGGSPLVCPIVGEPERFQQAGIVSWGLTCGTKDVPGVYSNVALFTDWIDMQMSFLNFDTTIYKP